MFASIHSSRPGDGERSKDQIQFDLSSLIRLISATPITRRCSGAPLHIAGEARQALVTRMEQHSANVLMRDRASILKRSQPLQAVGLPRTGNGPIRGYCGSSPKLRNVIASGMTILRPVPMTSTRTLPPVWCGRLYDTSLHWGGKIK